MYIAEIQKRNTAQLKGKSHLYPSIKIIAIMFNWIREQIIGDYLFIVFSYC